ncbi:MAG: endonuclease/exonuclease/phosphatase family protein [Verrucomicrobiota bacterium]
MNLTRSRIDASARNLFDPAKHCRSARVHEAGTAAKTRPFAKPMICLNWNIQWAEAGSPRGELIRATLQRLNPDVVCLTEATLSMIPDTGHSIVSNPDYGYPNNGSRRKVVLWSRTPWSEAEAIGAEAMPSGRFASGIAEGIRFVGVCVPWRDAHVRTGRRDRTPWQDHLTYLSGVAPVLSRYCSSGKPLCVIGDYNQPIPRARQPFQVSDALTGVLGDRLVVATAGRQDHEGKPIIDHYAHTAGITVQITEIIPKSADNGTDISDHVGVVASITIRGT